MGPDGPHGAGGPGQAAGSQLRAAGGGRPAAGTGGNRTQGRAKAARTSKKRAAEEPSFSHYVYTDIVERCNNSSL